MTTFTNFAVGNDLNLSSISTAIGDALALKAGVPANAIPEMDGNNQPIMLSGDDGREGTSETSPESSVQDLFLEES